MRFRTGKQRSSVAGNDYDKAFEVRAGEETVVFNSFECAIHAPAMASTPT
jgi:hypothetical protein